MGQSFSYLRRGTPTRESTVARSPTNLAVSLATARWSRSPEFKVRACVCVRVDGFGKTSVIEMIGYLIVFESFNSHSEHTGRCSAGQSPAQRYDNTHFARV